MLRTPPDRLPTGITLRPFRVAHAEQMMLGQQSARELAGLPLQALVSFERNGPGYTAFIRGEPAWCGGLLLLWPGVGDAWVLVSNLIWSHRKSFHQSFRVMQTRMIAELRLWRIQADVMEDFVVGRRWAESLGFVSEGRMLHFGAQGEHFIRYALVIPGNVR